MRQKYLQSIYEKERDLTYYDNITKEYGHMMTCFKVLYHESGEPAGILSVDIDVNDIQTNMKNYVVRMVFVALILMLFMLIVFISYINKYVTKPITEIALSTSDFVKFLDKNVSIEEIHYEKVYVSSKDEVGCLADDVALMAQSVKNYMKNLQEITVEKERIGAELNVATQIQADMLPNIFPAFPEHDEFDIYATMVPAKEVGGDFYDLFMVDESHLAIVMADVSGKGVPAALFMVIAKTLIKNHALNKEAPSQIFTNVNNQLCENNEVGMFVTGWMGIMDIFTGHMDYVNAGHNYPLIIRKNGSVEWIKSRPGFVLAGMEGVRYRQNELQLEEGDLIYLYTDGVTEALNVSQELFGDERLERVLSMEDVKEMKPEMLLHKVAEELNLFAGEAEQADDITMLALYRNVKEKYIETMKKSLKIQAKKEEWDNVSDFLEMQLEKAGCPLGVQTQILIAAEEIFVNIASYAYEDEECEAEIKTEIGSDRCFKIEFLDSGIPYNPLERENPDITLSAEERNIGGLGIFMVKKIMDDVQYEYREGKNRLILFKNI